MPAAVEDRVREGGVVLAFDTNAMSAHRKLIDLCNTANQLRVGPSPLDLRLYAPALAHAEMVLHLRHEQIRRGRTYDPLVVRQGLEDKGLEVMSFEVHHAEEVAALLAQRFGDPAAWKAAKRARCVSCLGLTKAQGEAAPGQSCAATVDWLIAGQALKEGWILVTGDKGPEFRGLDAKIELDALAALLRELVADRRAR
jgi:mono/diheme cytochrome c family protein